jgi:tripartite motif-containing protein 71
VFMGFGGMGRGRSLVAGLVCGVVGLGVSPAVVLGEGSTMPASSVGGSASSGSLFGSPFVVQAVESLDGGEQAEDVEEARRFSSGAFLAREVSQTAYEHLSAAQAKALAQRVFPSLVDEPAGGPPPLPSGARIESMPADNVARVDLRGGKHAVVESLQPIALETSSARHTPIDLHLRGVGGAFEPILSAVALRIPERLGGGVDLGRTGVSLTPVAADGSPLAGSRGVVEGATVAYANTMPDGDTLVKPTTYGFSAETLLRSVDSPRVLYFRVGLPAGARLVAAGKGLGVDVVEGGVTVAMVLAPVAHDAEDTPVPVSMGVTGNVLMVRVAPFAGVYRLPIVVDPTVEDPVWQNELISGMYYRTNWIFRHEGSEFKAPEHPEGGSWTETISGSHSASEWGGLFYTTRGASQITLSHVEGSWDDAGSHIQNNMVLDVPKYPYTEDIDSLPEATEGVWGGYACAPERKCPETTAGSAPPENNNTAGFEQKANLSGGGVSGWDTVTNAYVDVSQEKGPELEFNKTSSTVYNTQTKEYVPNVLYGSGGWLGPHSGAFEVHAKDPGVGLSRYRLETSGWGEERPYYGLGECSGIQCPEYDYQGYTYKTGMSNGEDGFEALADDAVGLYARIDPQEIKVDAAPPHGIKVSGFQNGNELPSGEIRLKVEATDGEGRTPSAGIKSIKVSVEGHEVSGTAASCSEGPCTASAEFTLAARDYTSGHHTLVVTATDNADNVAQEEFTFRVHGTSPVSIGPGSVDPSNGQLTLSATDVSLGDTGGVSRTYQSRDLTAGTEGPLGPQWALNVGGDEGLNVSPDGNAVLTAANGESTTFTHNEKGELESPKGDSDLKLAAKEKVSGKGISEYVLTDPTTGTKTIFEQPTAVQNATPTFVNRFGAEAGELEHPVSDAVDSTGNVWVTSYESDLVEKFSPMGVLLATYGSEGTAEGQFIDPWGIAIDPRNGDVYVSDRANNRVEELSSAGAFIKTFGWGVGKAGSAEFEICTKECKAGIADSGNGQFDAAAGLAVDSSGNVWVADYGNDRVQEFNEKGEYLKKFGSAGKGAEQFEGPAGITLSGGNLYITDSSNNRVQEFSTAGVHLGVFGEAGSENGKFSDPYGIASDPRTGNLYVVDSGNHRVQEFTSAGVFIAKFGVSGTGEGQFTSPQGIAVSSSESIYVVDNGANSVDVWTRPEWLPTEVGGPLGASTTTYSYTTVEAEGESIVVPKEALAPIPAGVSSCTPLVAGCRSLSFEYGKETTAKGGNSSEWGSYKGHLEKVWLHAYNPSSKEMTKTEVARYEYDSKGRLRAEWDPRLEHPLKTVYGYDSEGHLTALTPPGQETWVFTYGTIVGDPSTGRLLKVTRAPASTPLWGGEEVRIQEAPELSGSPVVGVRMGVSVGKWSSGPVAYGYQWEDCESTGKGCTAIPGATNANYTVMSSDVGYCLAVQVTATNGGGSVVRTTEPCRGVSMDSELSYYALPNSSNPYGITAGPQENEHLWFTDRGTSKIGEITTSGRYITEYSLPYDSNPYGITAGPTGDSHLWFTENGTNKIGNITTSGEITAYALPEGSKPYGITTGPDKNLWFTDAGTAKIGKITTSGTVTEYSLPSGSDPCGITAGPDGYMWFTDFLTSKVGWITTSGAITEYGIPGKSYGIAVGPNGNMWIADFAGEGIDDVDTVNQGKTYSPQPGSTIDYNVPVSGTGAPYALSKEEVEKWAQKDDPVEGTAIFPPDEPQGWPASDYTRATVHYWDANGRMVNTAVPTGGISTSEYNEANEVTRTLSADNRAAALKEGCKSVPKECKSAEVSEKLDTETEYNTEDTNVLKVVGPEHKAKLSTGEEVEARAVSRDYYDEGAKEAEEKNHESYDLLTKTTSGALLSNGEEKDVRTTTTSYSGQEDLGWKLRKATSTTLEPAGLDLVHKTVYEEHENAKKERESTGNVIETRAPSGNSEQVSPPSYSFHFGGSGSGNGQIKEPWGIALDSSENVWVIDSGNNRIEKFTWTGSFVAAYGKEGIGDTEFKEPLGIAVNKTTGNVYVADSYNDRIEEFDSSGGFVEAIGWGVSNGKSELEVCTASCKAGIGGTGNGQLDDPAGLTIDSHGDIWVADKGNNRVQWFSEAGAYLSQFGSAGSGNDQFSEPTSLTISEGSLYVVDSGNNRVEQFSMSGAYMGQFGGKGSGPGQLNYPIGIAPNPSTGALYVCDYGNERMEEFSPAGKFLTEWGTWGSTHQQSSPAGVAVGVTGKLYIIDPWANEVGVWLPPEAGGAHLSYSTQFGSKGSGNGQFNYPANPAVDGSGDVWVTDLENDRVEKFSPQGGFIAAYGKAGSGELEFEGPAGMVINKSTGNVYIADLWNNRIEELSSSGAYVRAFGTTGPGTLKEPTDVAIDGAGNIWVADRGNNRIVEFSSTGTYIAAYGKEGSGEDGFEHPVALAVSGTDVYVADTSNHRIEELTTGGIYVRAFGIEGNGSGEFWSPESIAIDAAGNLYVGDDSARHIEEFSSTGNYKATFGSPGTAEGQLSGPQGEAIDAAGDLYITDASNDRVEKWDNDDQAAHDTQTIYYSAEANSTYPNCGKHPEWANLVCQTQPAAQPDRGLPELPVSTVASYNIWDEAEKTEEKFGIGSKAVTRTKTQTYDSAGRALTSEEASSPATDQSLPKVTNEYNSTTGLLEKQSTAEGSIISKYNTLGQSIEYTDASGNVAKYDYEEGSDGRLIAISEGKGKEADSSQTYSYNATTGFLTKLVDSAAGIFTASYDVEGKMTSETYPNNMTANYTINSVGQATSLVYEKNTDCASKCPETWFSDSDVPSIHGETLQQTSTLSKENYAYDNAGRLLETQETPVGKGCITRLYAYDEESNRTSLTTREPGTEGKCATEGGTVERHTYDEADRLTDEGVTYETFGNITKLPASDAGGHELSSTYYLDGQVASQEQKNELIVYKYDPAGRTTETTSENKESKTNSTTISHYASPGSTPTWTSEGTEKWTRDIPGIDGTLAAIQESSGVTALQLHDLQGDIVGKASLSETETKLLSTYNSTEFGVPTTSSPPKYSWFGADGVASELTSSGVSTQNGSSYVPEIGRPLQTGPIASPGSFPNGTGGVGVVGAPYLGAASAQLKGIAIEEEAAHEEAKRLEAEENEGFCEKYPGSSACHVDGPGEGNCEVNCVAVIKGEEIEETLSVGFENKSGNANEAKYFDHEITVSKFIAGELGNAIFWTNHLGPITAGFFHVPSWLIQAVNAAADAKLVGGLDRLSANLLTAGSLASGPVTIHAYGDLKGYFWIDIEFSIEVGVDD